MKDCLSASSRLAFSPRADGALAEAKFIFGDGHRAFRSGHGAEPGELTLGVATESGGPVTNHRGRVEPERSRGITELAARQISRSFLPSPKEFFRRTHVWNAPSNLSRSKKVSWEGCWHWSRVLAFAYGSSDLAASRLGPGLDYSSVMRVVIPGAMLTALGFQTMLSSCFMSILGMKRK